VFTIFLGALLTFPRKILCFSAIKWDIQTSYKNIFNVSLKKENKQKTNMFVTDTVDTVHWHDYA
jgi:hypothetical protein